MIVNFSDIFNKSDIETIVYCSLMFEYYQVSIEKFEDVSLMMHHANILRNCQKIQTKN